MKVDYTQLTVDGKTFGVRVLKTSEGEIILEDDHTESYSTWDLTYDEIFNGLYECFLARIKRKNYTAERARFEHDLYKSFNRLTKRVQSLKWRPTGYFDFPVHHPERIISAPFYEDRIAEEWLTELFLKPYVEARIVDNNVACRVDKGPPKADEVIKETIKKLNKECGDKFYVLKYDIEKYFDNVSHEKIKELFCDMPAFGRILFFNIIDDWKEINGYAAKANPDKQFGIPKGNLPSQWTGIMYLNGIDRLLEENPECVSQIRYMDDGVAFFKSKEACRKAKESIEAYLKDNDMAVRLSERKSGYAPITKGFTFCGWRYTMRYDGSVKKRIRQDRKKLLKKKFKKMEEDYYRGKLSLDDVKAKLNGCYAFLRQGNTRELRRFLAYKTRFTHDKERFYKNKPVMNNKQNIKEETYEKDRT